MEFKELVYLAIKVEKQLKPRGATRFEYKGASSGRPNWSNSWKGGKHYDDKVVPNANKGKSISGSKDTSKPEINKEKLSHLVSRSPRWTFKNQPSNIPFTLNQLFYI